MSIICSLGSALRAFTGFAMLSLVTAKLYSYDAANLELGPNTANGVSFTLNSDLHCKSVAQIHYQVWTDTCVVVKGNGLQSLEVSEPWPTCADGTEAKFASFGADIGTCDSWQNSNAKMPSLQTKDEVVSKCKDIRGIGSFTFWCNGVKPLRPPVSPGDRTKEGFLIKFPTKECDHSQPVEYHKPDTCVEVGQGLGVEFRATAVCANGTNALIAGFKGKDCDPTDKPLENPFTRWQNRHTGVCIPSEEINSMTFWCDGLPGVDMRKPNRKAAKGPNLALILGLSIGLGGAFLLILGLVVVYNVNWHFRVKVRELFGSGDGYIAL